MERGLAVFFLFSAACAGGSPPRPEVSGVTPADGATGVALDSQVAIQFSEPMSCGATQASFTLTSPAGPVTGSAACSGSGLIFTPSGPLAVSTVYVVNIDQGAKAQEGGVLAAGFQSRFITGAPVVTGVQPSAGATGVALGTPVAVQFWEAMDCATVHAGSVNLVSAAGDVPIRVGCTGPAASVTPTSLLAPSTTYTLLVSSGVKDRAGNSLASYHASFTTASLTPLPDSVVPDQRVSAMALSEDQRTIYLSGAFSSVGRRTGSFVPIDAGSGRALPGLPLVDGWVNASAPDGAGGWFIGGGFDRVGAVSRTDLAHLFRDGSLDLAWDPGLDGEVTALAVDGNTLYVGGNFTSAGGQLRAGLAALEVSTGSATGWDPAPTLTWGPDYSLTIPHFAAIALSGSTVYIGGARGLNAVSAVTGSPPAWSLQSHDVNALAVSGSILYVAGKILADPVRYGLFSVEASTGTLTDWAPNPSGGAYRVVQALALSGSALIAGGEFTSIGGKTRKGLAAIDAVTGQVTDWDPGLVPLDQFGPYGHLPTVQSLGVSDQVLYAAGSFTAIGDQPRLGLGAIDLGSGAPTTWNPGPAMAVQTVCVSGATVSVGGAFYSLGGQPRSGLAAIDTETGALTAWDPNAGATWGWNQGVDTIVVAGSTVYVGGPFTAVGGRPRSGLAALDATTGAATSWDPSPSIGTPFRQPAVYSMAVSGSTVYVSGDFSEIGGQPRTYLAALDTATGVATNWDPPVANPGYSGMSATALIADGTKVHAIGSVLPGEGIATLDGITGVVLGSFRLLQPQFEPPQRAVAAAVSGSTLYVTGSFSTFGTAVRHGLAALDMAGDSVTAWDPDLGLSSSPVYGAQGWALAVQGPVVYVGGQFDLAGGHRRGSLAALDTVTGASTAWDPGLSGGIPWSIVATDSRVYVGGDFSSIGGETRGGFAILRP